MTTKKKPVARKKATKKTATKKKATVKASAPIPILSPLGGPSKELVDAANVAHEHEAMDRLVDAATATIEASRSATTAEDLGAALFASHVRGDSRTAQSGKRTELTVDEIALGISVFGGAV